MAALNLLRDRRSFFSLLPRDCAEICDRYVRPPWGVALVGGQTANNDVHPSILGLSCQGGLLDTVDTAQDSWEQWATMPDTKALLDVVAVAHDSRSFLMFGGAHSIKPYDFTLGLSRPDCWQVRRVDVWSGEVSVVARTDASNNILTERTVTAAAPLGRNDGCVLTAASLSRSNTSADAAPNGDDVGQPLLAVFDAALALAEPDASAERLWRTCSNVIPDALLGQSNDTLALFQLHGIRANQVIALGPNGSRAFDVEAMKWQKMHSLAALNRRDEHTQNVKACAMGDDNTLLACVGLSDVRTPVHKAVCMWALYDWRSDAWTKLRAHDCPALYVPALAAAPPICGGNLAVVVGGQEDNCRSGAYSTSCYVFDIASCSFHADIFPAIPSGRQCVNHAAVVMQL